MLSKLSISSGRNFLGTKEWLVAFADVIVSVFEPAESDDSGKVKVIIRNSELQQDLEVTREEVPVLLDHVHQDSCSRLPVLREN